MSSFFRTNTLFMFSQECLENRHVFKWFYSFELFFSIFCALLMFLLLECKGRKPVPVNKTLAIGHHAEELQKDKAYTSSSTTRSTVASSQEQWEDTVLSIVCVAPRKTE